jgi:hypothetical protein
MLAPSFHVTYCFGGLLSFSGGGVEVCPLPFDEALLSGLADGGAAASGKADGAVGVTSGLVLGTAFEFGVEFGLVSGVAFALGSGATVSGGIVLPGLVVALGLGVVALGLVLCVWAAGLCGLTEVGC